jgi:hypothetical protein
MTATAPAIHGPPRARTTTRPTTRTTAEIARSRSTWSTRASAPEPAVAAGELEEGGVEGVRPEVGPERVGGEQLGVRGLPDEEVREALLAARPDDEVRIGQAARVQRVRDRLLVDPGGVHAARREPPERIDELRPSGVVECDVQEEAVATRRRVEGREDRLPRRVGQLLEAAEDPDPHALLAQLGRLADDRLLEELEEAGHLVVGAGPVLPAERVQGEDADAAAHCVTQDRADGLDARRVAVPVAQAAAPRPSPVAVHDDGHVAWQLVGGQELVARCAVRRLRCVSDRRSVGRPGERNAGH